MQSLARRAAAASSLLVLSLHPCLAQDKAAAHKLEASLTAVTKVIAAGTPVELALRVNVKEDTSLDATVLKGMHLVRKPEGGQEVTLGRNESGTVAVSAGTVIERALKVDLDLEADPKATQLQRVSVRWPGLAGAEATVMIAPSQDFKLEDLDLSKTRALLITNYGTIKLQFFADKAPKHVQNFLKLSKSGFYNGTKFHRIMRNFMVQGGCPNTKEGATGQPGTGGPGYNVDAEFNDTRHVKGILSAARTADPNSAGCQFFLCHGTAPHLDSQYTAFGKIEEGEDTLDKIADVPVRMQGGGEASTPTVPVHLYQVVVIPAYKL